jgi:hypothetical protein
MLKAITSKHFIETKSFKKSYKGDFIKAFKAIKDNTLDDKKADDASINHDMAFTGSKLKHADFLMFKIHKGIEEHPVNKNYNL